MTTLRKRQRHKRRTLVQKRADQTQIAELYLKQKTQKEISELMGCSYQMIAHDLKEIREEWLTQAAANFGTRQATELARIDALEAEYWKGWTRSQETTETITETEEKDDEFDGLQLTKKQLQRVKRDGSVAFLQGIQWCVDQRCKILGLHAPKEVRVDQHTSQTLELSEMSTDQLREIVERNSRTAVEPEKAEIEEASFSEQLAEDDAAYEKEHDRVFGASERSPLPPVLQPNKWTKKEEGSYNNENP